MTGAAAEATARPRAVLVTGSRALLGFPGALAWLTAWLTAFGPALVVTGDAPGPDTWALAWAKPRRLHWRSFEVRGPVRGAAVPTAWTDAPLPGRHDAEGWRQRCLDRDAAMVERFAALTAYDLHVAALRASWSKTQGTAFTLRAALAAGLPATEALWSTPPGPARPEAPALWRPEVLAGGRPAPPRVEPEVTEYERAAA